MHPLERIEFRVGALKAAGLWREPTDAAASGGAGVLVDARSNDYLGLGSVPVSRETMGPVGAGASRLISGTYAEHRKLEHELADWLGFEECLLFSSGYAANVGAISALAGPGELILSDALNHASIIDGCRLSRAEVLVLPHADVSAFERALASSRGVRWVVTESYFGMDGDSPNLAALRRLCDAHGAALIVDEAHALGVFGPRGRGLCADAGIVPDALIGGMGKALAVQGGFVACSRLFRDWLWNRARSLVFSTAPSPALCSLALERVKQVQQADAARVRLRTLETRLVELLRLSGVACPAGRHGPIFPVILGTEAAVLAGASRARELGVLCHPIRPPTVPRSSSRLRISLRADMSNDDVDRIAEALESAWLERKAREPGPLESSDQPESNAAGSPAPGHGAPTPWRPQLITADAAASGDVGPRRDELPAGVRQPWSTRDEREREPSTDATSATGEGPHFAASSSSPGRRWIVLGTGTGIGKTFVARGLVRLLAATNDPVAGLKPIETGVTDGVAADARDLEALASRVTLPAPHPLYGLPEPVTPSRAARIQAIDIDLRRVAAWVAATKSLTPQPAQLVIETAGGVFSPLADERTNFDLSLALGPAIWLLVAPNRLGVLHDVTSALYAMAARGRAPDWIILSAPEAADASTASNRAELARLQSMPPIIELPRNDHRPLEALLRTARPW